MFSMILLTTQFFTPQSLGCARDGGHCQSPVKLCFIRSTVRLHQQPFPHPLLL